MSANILPDATSPWKSRASPKRPLFGPKAVSMFILVPAARTGTLRFIETHHDFAKFINVGGH